MFTESLLHTTHYQCKMVYNIISPYFTDKETESYRVSCLGYLTEKKSYIELWKPISQ